MDGSRDFPCREFQHELAEALAGRPSPAELTALSWHTHLATCEACRDLLAAEEALEGILASLPVPVLPREVAVRVLARLEAVRREEVLLDALLALDAGIETPAGLAAGVLAGLRSRGRDGAGLDGAGLDSAGRNAALERALDALPAPVVPGGLAARVLAGLESERAPAPDRRGLWTRPAVRFGLAAALTLAVGAASWFVLPPQEATLDPGFELAAVRAQDLPPEFCETMPVLERWELVTANDVDILLAPAYIAEESAWRR